MEAEQYLPLEEAEKILKEVSKVHGFDSADDSLFKNLTKSVEICNVGKDLFVNAEDLKNFVKNFQAFAKGYGKSRRELEQSRELIRKPVDVLEFIESPDYYGQGGSLFESTRKTYREIWEDPNRYQEVVLTGGESIGKSYIAEGNLAYMVYRLSCYENPQAEFGLAPGSDIIFAHQSVTLTKAKKVLLNQCAARIAQSPYFKKYFMFDKNVKSELRFPKQITIIPLGGSDTSAIGLNILAGILDELNFMQVISNSAKTTLHVKKEYDQAEQLYGAIIRRIKGRFAKSRKVPGKLFLVSARNYPGDFTSRKCEEAKTDDTIYVMNYAQWDALPPDRYSKEVFLVEVGNEFKQSRIIESMEEAVEESDVIKIPVFPYKKDFERDIEGALRSYGGIATGVKNPFIPQRDLIISASESHVQLMDGKSLFKKDSVVISKYWNRDEAPDWTQIVDMEYVEECILDPNVAFAAHADLATTQCNAGLAVGRVLGFNNMTSYSVYSERDKSFKEVSNVLAPVFMIDGVLAIEPPVGDEIDIDAIRSLVLFLKTILNIRWATADSHESAAMLQAFRKYGIRSGVVSVELSTTPYVTFKEAIKDKRVLYPDHALLKKEIRELERDTAQDKIIKPPGGSKDLSDSVSSVVHILSTKEGAPRQNSVRNLNLNDEKLRDRKQPVRQIRTLGDESIEAQRASLIATQL